MVDVRTECVNKRECAVVLQFESRDIGNGAIYAIYHSMYKVMGEGPRVDAVHNTLSYQDSNPKRLEKAKRNFKQLMRFYGK